MKKNKTFISSNEFKRWAFCPKQWYLLRTRKINTGNSATRRGVDYHKRMSHGVKAVQRAQSNFKTTLLIGGIACILYFWLR
jgi:hypothetical protein